MARRDGNLPIQTASGVAIIDAGFGLAIILSLSD